METRRHWLLARMGFPGALHCAHGTCVLPSSREACARCRLRSPLCGWVCRCPDPPEVLSSPEECVRSLNRRRVTGLSVSFPDPRRSPFPTSPFFPCPFQDCSPYPSVCCFIVYKSRKAFAYGLCLLSVIFRNSKSYLAPRGEETGRNI